MKYFTLLVALCATLFSTKIAAQPTTAPPTPTKAAADVTSLFSGAYTDLAGTGWNRYNGGTTYSEVTIASNLVQKYDNLNYSVSEPAAVIDASSKTHLHVDIWSAATGAGTNFKIKLVDFGANGVYQMGDDTESEISVSPNPGGSAWVSYDIPLSDFTTLAARAHLAQFIISSATTGQTFYLDNIYFWKPSNTPNITGFNIPAKVVGDAAFTLTAPTSNSTGAFTYTSGTPAVATISGNTVTIVGAGTSIITATQAADANYVTGSVTASLIVSSAGPQTAATTPTRAAADVISLYSNAYTDLAGTGWNRYNGGTNYAEVMIAGNATQKYTGLNYSVSEPAAVINATTKTHLHLDVWTAATGTNFKIKLVDFGANGVYQMGDDTESEISVSPNPSGAAWVSYDIALSDFSTLAARAHLAQFIISSATAGQTFWVDNIYFYTDAVVATEPTTAATTPTRAAANVISLYSNAYTDLAGTGWNRYNGGTGYAEVMIAGNATQKYTSLNYSVSEPAATIDATSKTHLHMDVWTLTAGTNFKVKLVDFGANGVYQMGDDSESEITVSPNPGGGVWVSYDIALSSFTTLAAKAHLAQFIISSADAGRTFWVDNIYFYNEPPTTPTTAATIPTRPAANVISLYSGAYTDLAGTTWNRYNGGTVYTEMTVAGNATQKYTGLGYSVTEPAAPINTGNATHLHLDVWSPNAIAAGVFKVKLVDFGANGTYGFSPTTGDDTEGEVTNLPAIAAATWTALDIPFTDFAAAGLTNKSHIAQFIPSGGGTVFMDNIYFYAATVLAVELTTVKAKAVNNTTVLTWQTASEKDNAGFTIERSADATNFTAIGNVKGNGTTNATSDYTFTDATPLTGINYYRLRQADFNGKESFSKVVSVAFGKNVLVLRNTLVQNTLEVVVSEAEKGSLSIFNVSGQLVFSATVQGTQVLDVSSLTAGMYIVRTQTGEARRFVKH